MFVSLRIFITATISWIQQLFLGKEKLPTNSIYDFKIPALTGETIDFNQYKGKKLLIVNTASNCGFTNQYQDLQKLHESFHDSVTVLGFPANDFLWQEPGSNSEIANFCTRNFGVTFQMFEKISVKGRNMHPIYRWLKSKSGKAPAWNFCKYLVDESGEVIDFYLPKVKPLDPLITNKIVSSRK